MLPKCECGRDQVPGRTITESEYSTVVEWAKSYALNGWKGRTVLAEVGITVVPDPEPTNAEKLEQLYRNWSQSTLNTPFGEWANSVGVKAPEEWESND